MGTLDHRRRRPSAGPDRTGESEEKVPQVDVTQTALSPEEQGHVDPMGRVTTESVETPRMRAQGVRLSVSPGAMEQGLVASPFHSELVQSEVALRLSRPSTLDADALTLAGQREARDAAPVREFEGIRVVRVERSPEQTAPSARPQALGPSGHLAGRGTPEPPAVVGELALVGQGPNPSPAEARGSPLRWSWWTRGGGHCPCGAKVEQ